MMLSTESVITNGSVLDARLDTRRMLVERRQQLLHDLQARVRDAREGGTHTHHAPDPREAFEAEPEDDLAFVLIEMKAAMLERINHAVRQVDEGTYGLCVDCGDAIAPSRLRALPFAVRCRDCEDRREHEQRRDDGRARRVASGMGWRY